MFIIPYYYYFISCLVNRNSQALMVIAFLYIKTMLNCINKRYAESCIVLIALSFYCVPFENRDIEVLYKKTVIDHA